MRPLLAGLVFIAAISAADRKLLPVHVAGHPDATEFRVTVNGVEQTVTVESGANVPISLAVILDSSTSRRGWLAGAVKSVAAILTSLPAGSEALVLNVSDPSPATFTADLPQLAASLNSIRPAGGTRLNDALFAALESLDRNARHPRRILLAFTDGDDNNSLHSMIEVQRRADRSLSELYLVAPFSRPGDQSARSMQELVTATGGRAFLETDPHLVRAVAEALAGEVLLGLPPEATGKVKVQLKSKTKPIYRPVLP